MYRGLRNMALICFGIVLAIYAFYPLAPPRMLPGFADTMRALPVSFYSSNQSPLVNAYAAMPSVHYGLVLLVAIGIFRSGGRAMKALAVAYQGLMMLTIVVTGNHYFLDILAAMGLVGLAWLVYAGVARWRGKAGGILSSA